MTGAIVVMCSLEGGLLRVRGLLAEEAVQFSQRSAYGPQLGECRVYVALPRGNPLREEQHQRKGKAEEDEPVA
jgi:hypothetical protein